MPTLTIVNPNLLASVLEDSLFAPPATQTKVGYNFANFLTAGNESSDTDGFMITGIAQGKLYVNTGSTTAPIYKELVQVVTSPATQIQVDFAGMAGLPGGATPVAIGAIELTVRLTGVFLDNTKISGSDSKLYWEPNLALNANGLTPAFYIRSADNTNSTWNDGGDLVSATNILVSINVTAVNDAPTATASSATAATEQINLNLHGTGLSVADVDLVGGLAGTVVNVTLGVSQGIVTVAVGGSGTTVASGNGTNSVVVTGTLAQVNALLGGTGTVVYNANTDTPAASTALTLTVSDNNSGSAQGTGGVLTGFSTTTILVTAVNDAPVNAVPGAQTTVGNVVAFNTGAGNALSVTDVDAAAGSITTTLSVTVGTLAATLSGSALVTGSGSNTVVITGSLTDVNASLQTVVFTGTGDSTLTMGTSDNGNTGTPGAMTDTDDTVLISVAPAVISVTEPANGVYSVANTLDPSYIVTFDSVVVVDTTGGTPRIAITIDTGGPTVYATYASGSGSTALTFTYDVLIAHNDANGIVASGTIDLNGGTIKSPGGSNAILTLVGLDPTPAVLVDNFPPEVPGLLDLAAADDTAGASNTDDITFNTTALSISGTGDNAATVTLFDDLDNSGTFNGGDATLGSALVAGGVWSVEAALAAGVHNVRAFATDTALNVSAASGALTITVDTTVAAPTGLDLDVASDSGITNDNITNDTTPTINGSGEIGATVTLTSSVGGVLGTAVVDGASAWSFTTGVLAQGVHSLTATQTDVAGNVSAVSGALAITIDSIANPPAGLDLATASDSGSSSTDNITFDTTPTITGTGEIGAVVTLTSNMDGALAPTAVVDGSGNWSITTGALTENVHSLTATQTDVAGNVSAASGALAITVDITAPAVPTDPDLLAADDKGVSDTDNITNQTTGLTFGGSGEIGSTVSLFIDANDDAIYQGTETILGTGLVDMTTAWSFDSSPLAANATYVIRAFATDVAGNVSAASAGASVLTVVVDTAAPAAPVVDLQTADDSGVSNSDNITNVATGMRLDITGAVANSSVNIYMDAVLIGSAVVTDGAGAVIGFVVPGTSADGVHAFTATTVDIAGNTSLASAALNVTIDTVGPAVTYNGASYNADTNVLTIEGTGFNGLGSANVTGLVQANAAELTWDVDGGFTTYNLASADVFSATVADDRTLVIVLNQTPNITDLEDEFDFGSPDAAVTDPLDSIAITAAFVGTDLAGNAGTGSTAGIQVLGAQNEGDMPHTYTAMLATVAGATDDTLGEDGISSVDFNAANFAGLTMVGTSAAQISAFDIGMGGAYMLSYSTALDDGISGPGLLVQGVSGVLDTEFTFADGSMLKDNTLGSSDTLSGTANGDQLIASAFGDRLLGNAGNDLLVGGAGADAIYGGSGNDLLYGAGGNDYLSGGSGADTFIYTSAADGEGYDVIYGFSAAGGDVINVDGGVSAAAMLALATQSGSDTLITLNGTETIRLLGVTASSLTAANFAVNDAFIKGMSL